jgi:hypothetical protein
MTGLSHATAALYECRETRLLRAVDCLRFLDFF